MVASNFYANVAGSQESVLYIIPQFLQEKEHIFCWVVFAGSVYCVTVSQAPTVKMYLCFL